MASTSTEPMLHIAGLREIADGFDVYLLDMWGVMHDGFTPYAGVLEVIKELNSAGKRMIILSNSSKRGSNSVKMLRKLGFDPDDFEAIITSGEVAHAMLSSDDTLNCENWPIIESLRQQDTQHAFVLGSGDGDVEYCQSCGWNVVPLDDASLIVARGTFTIDDGTVAINRRNDGAAYEEKLDAVLATAASRRLPMIVCNPDKIRPDAERPPMPGKIGHDYYNLLGGDASLVKRVGKPFPDVYDIALKGVDRSRTCMIGDSLETDVAGGSIAGIATVWVLEDGIHSPDLAAHDTLQEGAACVLEEFNEKEGTYAGDRALSPTYVIPTFRW